MHKAPAVDYPVGRSRFQTSVLLLLAVAVFVVDGLWFYQEPVPDWRHGLGLATSLAALLIALRARRIAPSGRLHWDGQAWLWLSNGAVTRGVVNAHLDFQDFLLIAFHPEAGPRRWLWLEKAAAAADWSALRRAVHGSAQADGETANTGSGGQPARDGGAAQP